MCAAKLTTLQQGRPSKENASIDAFSQDKAAELFKVSRPTVQRARALIEKGIPTLVIAVEQDKVAVSKAAKIAERSPAEQKAWLAGWRGLLDILRPRNHVAGFGANIGGQIGLT